LLHMRLEYNDWPKEEDLDDKHAKIAAFNNLAHRLPPTNFTLLSELSAFLIEIVDASATNKMNVRNVGIVFAPTLNIPAPLISFFLTDYDDIFGGEAQDENTREQLVEVYKPQNAPQNDWEGIRSPRHQMFTDLPTPAYNNSGFQGMGGFAPLPQQQGRPTPQPGMNGGYGQGSQDYYAQQPQDPSYNSLNGSLAPPPNHPPPQPGMSAKDVKKARRESNMQMLGYGIQPSAAGGSIADVLAQQRTGSYQSLRQGDRDGSRGRGSPARGPPGGAYWYDRTDGRCKICKNR
jgi:RalA-binding protein 1